MPDDATSSRAAKLRINPEPLGVTLVWRVFVTTDEGYASQIGTVRAADEAQAERRAAATWPDFDYVLPS